MLPRGLGLPLTLLTAFAFSDDFVDAANPTSDPKAWVALVDTLLIVALAGLARRPFVERSTSSWLTRALPLILGGAITLALDFAAWQPEIKGFATLTQVAFLTLVPRDASDLSLVGVRGAFG